MVLGPTGTSRPRVAVPWAMAPTGGKGRAGGACCGLGMVAGTCIGRTPGRLLEVMLPASLELLPATSPTTSLRSSCSLMGK